MDLGRVGFGLGGWDSSWFFVYTISVDNLDASLQ